MEPARSNRDLAWRRFLLALCVVGAAWVAMTAADNFGLNGRPWFGWWDSYRSPAGPAFEMVFHTPRPGGATAVAGIRAGDIADMRDQTYLGRVTLLTQPIPTERIVLIIRRGAQTLSLSILGSTVWEGEPIWKFIAAAAPIVPGVWFLICAFLIAQRRAGSRDGRTLALALLGLVPAFLPQNAPVFPNPTLTMLSGTLTLDLGLGALALVTWLGSRYGTRSRSRTVLTALAYAFLAFAAWAQAALWIGATTLRIDPVPYYWGAAGSTATVIAAVSAVLLASVAAVRSVEPLERSRAGWLLLPLPIAVLGSTVAYFGPSASSWFFSLAFTIVGTVLLLAGALAVTYALLRRRVLDVGFVLSRTLAVAGVSLVVVVAFVLLEWALGTVLQGVSHATGLFANAALALVLGLSMRYIHRRVDSLVDSMIFRKRYEDEHALRAFAKEAGFITDTVALFDLTIATLRAHTDATGAALLLNGDGTYKSVRCYGDVPTSAGENDPAILALKAWHEPVDPHRYRTALTGDLAVPVVARGQLHGVLLFEQRATGEAYAPDEIAALAQFAHGIGSAYDTLARRGDETNATVAAISALLERRFGPLQ
jgi:hypothetical protein